MAATPSIKIEKTIPFKGGTRLYSNRYHFNGGTPADATHWHTLMDAVTAAEKLTHTASTTITNAIGYAAGSDVPVAEKTYALAGTYSPSGTWTHAPGEVAGLIRWSTASRSTKNHPIYCFSYMHCVAIHTDGTNQDLLFGTQKTLFETYANAWITGFSDGSITAVRATPQGAAATGYLVEEYVTHRDFPYTRSQ